MGSAGLGFWKHQESQPSARWLQEEAGICGRRRGAARGDPPCPAGDGLPPSHGLAMDGKGRHRGEVPWGTPLQGLRGESWSTEAAIIKQTYFSQFGGWGSKIMVSADVIPGQRLLIAHGWLSFALMSPGGRGGLALWGLFRKDTNHIPGSPPS